MSNLLYSKSHVWIRVDEGVATIGLTDYAQKKLGNILFITLPDEGEEIYEGTKFGDVESIKTVSDLLSPINGIVVGINEDIVDNPSTINEEPFESWMLKVRIDQLPEGLMDEKTYDNYKGAL